MLRSLSILSMLVFTGSLTGACDDTAADYDENEVSRAAETVRAEAASVLAVGVGEYAVTRDAACSRVALRGAAAELGTLVGCTSGGGELRLELAWAGRTTEFTIDTTQRPAPLQIRRGARTAVVLEGETPAGEAAALFEAVRGDWDLARAVFVELDLAPGLLASLDQQVAETLAPLYTEDLAASVDPVADGGCPNICHQGGCAWVWDQYCHTFPIGSGLCQVGVCGCGDC